ncbi:MAG: prepilin-type N-terminal cleavage/methylation domain-containing protein [Actinomycetota bacterium]|nr:prepilin-type N-terminal cleavage/methylation domain-containing protein [Actinomycetota bacterium]
MEAGRYCLIKDGKGFSLVELVIVISILGFLLAVAIPVWNSFVSSSNHKAAIRQVATDIRETQSKAMAELKYYGIEFDEGGSSYSIYSHETANNAALFVAANLEQEVSLSDLNGVSFSSITFNNSYGPDRVIYKKDGSISGVAGSVYLTNGSKFQQLSVVTTGKLTIK